MKRCFLPLGTGTLLGVAAVLAGCDSGNSAEDQQASVPTSRPAMAAATAPTPLPPANKVVDAFSIHKHIPKRTTASGLVIQDVHIGEGPTPKHGDEVTLSYTGWLADGKVFDASQRSGHPFSFKLARGQVIAGWDEGVGTMNLGGKRVLTIPPALGYGHRTKGNIPPDSTLTFEVELLGINGTMVPPKPVAPETLPATTQTQPATQPGKP